ncbi:GNAT family N-acetyltransferase [Flaviaesturariibacter amylovorans]|uniref:N-acetyltransferase domain-containing protein n=1 Tax=Flaviaesturariibacter amylovorans TaxID=1084520 RepID=A0ABP8GIQ6_9BACT
MNIPTPIFPPPPISRPGPDDFDEVLQVWEDSVRATHHFLVEADIQVFRTLVPQLLEVVDLYCTRDEAGRISGFLGIADGKIEMLFMRSDQRGKGIGKALTRFALDELKIRKVDVNEQNMQALGFYRHAGFVVVDRSATDGLGKPYPILHMEYPG